MSHWLATPVLQRGAIVACVASAVMGSGTWRSGGCVVGTNFGEDGVCFRGGMRWRDWCRYWMNICSPQGLLSWWFANVWGMLGNH